MKRPSLLLCLLLCLPLTAHADEASRRVKAQEMVTLLHMDTLMQQMMDTMQKQMSSNLRQLCACDKTATPQQQALLDDFTKKAFALVESRMGWKSLEPEILDLYARTFNDEELDGMLAFYKSPAGVSMITKMPTITTQAAQISQSKMSALIPEMQKMIQDFAKAESDAAPASANSGKSQSDQSGSDQNAPQKQIIITQ